jgi:hypothetical protein
VSDCEVEENSDMIEGFDKFEEEVLGKRKKFSRSLTEA